MPLLSKIRAGLAAKLAVCMIASTAVFFTSFGFINLRMERSHSEELIRQSAYRTAGIIRRSTHDEMLHNDRYALLSIIQAIGSETGIRRIRVLNKEGRITLSTEPSEINTVVDKNGEACYGCHQQSAPLTRLNRTDRARRFTDKQGKSVLAVIQPVNNAPECSNAACHVHPAGQQVLGVIDANLSLDAVDEQIAQHQASLGYYLLGAIVLGSALAVAFIWIMVYQPVKKLIDGTHRVADGDLSYRLPEGSADELGDLARSFNRMTSEVAGAQAEIEERVRRKTAELERVHRSLMGTEKMASIGKLAATVAHEINNPLFGILTYARLVERELGKHEFSGRDDLVEQLQTIERESKRCGDLVRNLLTFSRQAPSHREPNDFNTIVERASVLVKHKLEMQNIELREHLSGGLPQLECDANQIQQVVLVLMVNASEAMPKGGVIEVSTEFDPALDQETVVVKDNGSGIPADVLLRIFDPFFTTKEEQLRTGLGLAVAKSIVEQHGGEITVRSTAGEGTEFRVTLPAVAVAALAAR
jgi:two-component system NtrC family sensor kinase